MLTIPENIDSVGQRIDSEAHLKVALFKTQNFCKQLGFNPVASSKITTAASELVRNILKYAGSGQLCIHHYCADDQQGLEMVVCDSGPGIADLDSAMMDNYSSGGTLGMGLPGVERLMDYFCIQSEVGKGTVVTVRKFL
ncbi:MAG: serine/threonine-protein kinase RsbT [Phenylobacterium sp.]|jgi:serine/threonine-protein kinase RsbT